MNVLWAAGERFNNLRQDAEFQLVPTRKAAAEVVKALKAGKTTVDLTGNSDDDEEAATSAAAIAVDVAAIASSDISDASTVSADDNAEASGTAASPDGPADGNI